MISNLQKDFHQDNLSFVCLQFYKHNCLTILADNISCCTGKLQKNGHKGGLSYNFNQLRVSYV